MPGTDPIAQSDFGPFPALVNMVTTGTGAQAGMNLYTFKEQYGYPTSGALVDAVPGRMTNPQTGTPASGYALEVNNRSLQTPFYCWMRYRGITNGVPVYDFQAPPQPPNAASVISSIQSLPNNSSTAVVWTGSTLDNWTPSLPLVSVSAGKLQLNYEGHYQFNATAFLSGTSSVATGVFSAWCTPPGALAQPMQSNTPANCVGVGGSSAATSFGATGIVTATPGEFDVILGRIPAAR